MSPMKLRMPVSLAIVACAAGWAGWSAIGTDGWPPEAENTGSASIHHPVMAMDGESDRLTPASDTVRRAQPMLAAPSEIFGWSPSLLDPHAMLPAQAALSPQTASAPPQTAGTETTPAAEMPAVREPAAQTPARTTPTAAAKPPKDKPKRDTYDGKLTVAQVAHIRQRLRLTPDQEEYWRPVEAILLDLAKKQARSGAKVTLSPDASMNLYWVAGPLMMRLREDQKQEARHLARTMGLQSVAELI